MSNFTIYHNPRCSKSRLTLDLLKGNGIDPKIVLYLENHLSEKNIVSLLKKLGQTARGLLRKGEQEYKDQKLADESKSENQLIQAMVRCPKLIERPIVTEGDRAILGRPPEKVLNLI